MGINLNMDLFKSRVQKMSKAMSTAKVDAVLEKASKPTLESMKKHVGKRTWKLHDSLGVVKKKGSARNRKFELGSKADNREDIEKMYYHNYGGTRRVGSHFIEKSASESKAEAHRIMVEGIKKEFDLK